jgi:hypothetical protein
VRCREVERRRQGPLSVCGGGGELGVAEEVAGVAVDGAERVWERRRPTPSSGSRPCSGPPASSPARRRSRARTAAAAPPPTGTTSHAARRARSSTNPCEVLKFGSPLVWLSNWRMVTPPQAAGSPGARSAIVSSRPSFPCCTRRSATAPLNALVTLPRRMWSLARGAPRRRTSARPARRTVNRPSRYSVTIVPGGPPREATNRSRPRDKRRRAQPSQPPCAAQGTFQHGATIHPGRSGHSTASSRRSSEGGAV